MSILHRFILIAICVARIVASESANVEPAIESAADVAVDTPNEANTALQENDEEPSVPDVITPNEKVTINANANDDAAAEVCKSNIDQLKAGLTACESKVISMDAINAAAEVCRSNTAQLKADLTTCESKITSMDAAITDVSNELSQTITSFKSCQEEQAQASSRVIDLQKDIETLDKSLTTSRNGAQACREEVATCLSDHNDALQNHDALEQKYRRIKGIHGRQSKELHEEIATLQSEIEKSKKAYKTLQNKYHDEREQVNGLEKVLKRMHHDATRTYVNTTLMMEDTIEFLSKSIDRSIVWTEDAMARKEVKNVQRKVVDVTSPALSFVRESYDTHAASHIHDLKLQLRDIDAVEGMRLFLVSLVEQVGKTGLDYLELTDDAISSDGNRGHSRGRGHKRRKSRFRSILERKMKYAKRNGELIVDQFFFLCIVYIMFKVFKFFLLNLIFRLISGRKKGETKQTQE